MTGNNVVEHPLQYLMRYYLFIFYVTNLLAYLQNTTINLVPNTINVHPMLTRTRILTKLHFATVSP